MSRVSLLLLISMGASACTFAPGNAGFATLTSAQLRAAHDPG